MENNLQSAISHRISANFQNYRNNGQILTRESGRLILYLEVHKKFTNKCVPKHMALVVIDIYPKNKEEKLC